MLCEGLLSIILRRGVVSGARPSTLGGRISGPLRTVRGIWAEIRITPDNFRIIWFLNRGLAFLGRSLGCLLGVVVGGPGSQHNKKWVGGGLAAKSDHLTVNRGFTDVMKPLFSFWGLEIRFWRLKVTISL